MTCFAFQTLRRSLGGDAVAVHVRDLCARGQPARHLRPARPARRLQRQPAQQRRFRQPGRSPLRRRCPTRRRSSTVIRDRGIMMPDDPRPCRCSSRCGARSPRAIPAAPMPASPTISPAATACRRTGSCKARRAGAVAPTICRSIRSTARLANPMSFCRPAAATPTVPAAASAARSGRPCPAGRRRSARSASAIPTRWSWPCTIWSPAHGAWSTSPRCSRRPTGASWPRCGRHSTNSRRSGRPVSVRLIIGQYPPDGVDAAAFCRR